MQEDKFIFDLGAEVKDALSGFKGIVKYRVQYMTGCNQYGILPAGLDEKGQPHDTKQFDENQLIATGKKTELPDQTKQFAKVEKEVKKPGGPNHKVSYIPRITSASARKISG